MESLRTTSNSLNHDLNPLLEPSKENVLRRTAGTIGKVTGISNGIACAQALLKGEFSQAGKEYVVGIVKLGATLTACYVTRYYLWNYACNAYASNSCQKKYDAEIFNKFKGDNSLFDRLSYEKFDECVNQYGEEECKPLLFKASRLSGKELDKCIEFSFRGEEKCNNKLLFKKYYRSYISSSEDWDLCMKKYYKVSPSSIGKAESSPTEIAGICNRFITDQGFDKHTYKICSNSRWMPFSMMAS